MKRSIAAFLIVSATASAAWAGTKTDREEFQKFLSKVAPADISRAKMPCVCLEASLGQRAGRVTQLTIFDQVVVLCTVPIFNGAGAQVDSDLCAVFQVVR
jgi:hypothetical protein